MAIIFTLRSYGRRVSRKLEGGTTVLRHLSLKRSSLSFERYLLQQLHDGTKHHDAFLPSTMPSYRKADRQAVLAGDQEGWTLVLRVSQGCSQWCSFCSTFAGMLDMYE
eukprot:1178886-Prorocentrum_minimum.AAC.3